MAWKSKKNYLFTSVRLGFEARLGKRRPDCGLRFGRPHKLLHLYSLLLNIISIHLDQTIQQSGCFRSRIEHAEHHRSMPVDDGSQVYWIISSLIFSDRCSLSLEDKVEYFAKLRPNRGCRNRATLA